ncbi:MAG TPA: response regulator transcription factor [Bacteroidota bacterium]|nr:response regulator transcription factor [Bacteroidota bacterium]
MKKLNIMLADDHPEFRRVVREFLSRLPNVGNVYEVSDGHEAVHANEVLHPDIIVMDIGMPVMNGLEATRIIKEKHPETRVVIATMHDNPMYKQHAIEVKADGFFFKAQLKENLEAMLGSQHSPVSSLFGE